MEAVCPSCGKKYKVADNSAGKRARCTNPGCGKVFVIQDTPAGSIPEAIPLDAGPQPAAPAPRQPLGGTGGLDAFGPASPSPLDDLLAADVPAAPLVSPVPPLAQAPTLRPVARPRRDWKKPALIAGAGAAGLLLMIGLIVALISMGGGDGAATSAAAKGGPLEWAGWALPNDAKGLGYIHVEKLLASEFFKMIEKTVKSAMSNMPNVPSGSAGWDAFKDNVSEILFVMTAGKEPIVVVKTRQNMELTQAASLIASAQGKGTGAETDQESAEPKTHAGFEYVGVSDGFMAKIGDRTFCGADGEEDLKAALGRLEQKHKPSLSGDLRRAVDSAQGDHFFAMVGPAETGFGGPFPSGAQAGPKPEWVGFGVSVNSHLVINGAAGLPAAEDAAKIKRDFDAQMAKMQEAESQMAKMPPQFREGIQKMLNLVRAIRLSQDGNAIRVTAKWSRQDVQGLIAQMEGFIRMAQMPKPRFGP